MRTGPVRASWWRTLRVRLMAWNAAVVVVTAVAVLVGLREGVRITLVRELDQVLAEDLSEINLALARYRTTESVDLRDQLNRKDTGHAQHKWFVQLLGDEGRLLFASSHAPSDAPLPANREPQTVGEWRVTQRRESAVPGVTIRVGASLEMIRSDVKRIDRLVATAAGLVLLAAPLCGYWLAGRTTRPLNQMIDTMVELRPSSLSERLKIRGTGDEIDRLSATFNGLLDRIGIYLQEHRDFLANAAHELRTPLTAIRSSVEVTLANPRSVTEYQELLGEIIEESASLETLVNQLLLLSETEGERLRFHREQVRLDQLIEKALDMFGGVAEFRGIELVRPPLPGVEVRGNRGHLRQVVRNLLDNALKFTPPGGRVVVDLSLDVESVTFTVTDTGSGIPAEDLPHVFDRFYRGLKGRFGDGEVRGTGLGLSICEAIVRAHGGMIRVDNHEGPGTRVTVRFPRTPHAVDALVHSLG